MVRQAPALGLTLDLTPARPALRRGVLAALDAVAAEPAPDRITTVGRLVEDAGALGLDFGLWDVQNRFFEIWRTRADARPMLAPLGATLGFNLDLEDA